jgi:hypothetical protein
MTERFRRKLGERRYKRMFVIVAEGTVTEQEYFSLLSDESIVRVRCLKNRRNLPPNEALKRVRGYIREESLRRTDEAWVVVDRDQWLDEHLTELHRWSQEKANHGFALSNPKFELWLLLHFDDAGGVTTGDECQRRLERYLENYDKHIKASEFTRERILNALARAKRRDNPRCVDWPRNIGTTVYRLVEKILQPTA